MQSTNWTPEHSNALREYLAKGMSYSEIAAAINAKFKTGYSRNAAIGRAKRMGLVGPDRPEPAPKAKAPRLHKLRERYASGLMAADTGVRTRGDRQTSLCRYRTTPPIAGSSRTQRLPLPLWRR